MKKIISLILALSASFAAMAAVTVTSLRTETLETPLGIDEARPVFSWQMVSDRIGASQRAYHLTVCESSGAVCFDSGTVYSDASLNIPYEGKALRGGTRYFWKVAVTDEEGIVSESEPTWFETGLMGLGWGKAEWIGSEAIGASKYRTFFVIDYDVQVEKGSTSATFVYSAKDKDNYISVTLDVAGSPKLVIDYAVEGDLRHLSTIDVAGIVTDRYAPHHIKLDVSTPGYHLKSNLIASLDGEMLRPSEGVPGGRPQENVRSGNPYQMVITPYPGGERVHDWARLHSIGFRQAKGQKAAFSNIRISENNWGTTLYTDPEQTHKVTGDGRLHTWEPYGLVSAPMLRRDVTVKKSLKSARLYITARGIYEFYINGQRVSNDWFNPGWTDYRYRIMYNSYDVTSMLHEGANGLGAMLGTGWYSDLNIFTAAYVDPYGIKQSMLAKVVLTYEDGSTETIVSDKSWKKYDNGPVKRNGFQFGEDYDARNEVDGWTDAGFNDSTWDAADVFERPAPSVQIQAYVGLPIQNNITLTARSVSEPVKGTFVYDLGQNIVGVPRLEGMKGRAGQVVTLRFGEMVYPETIPTDPVEPYTVELYQKMKGQAYIENYRGAISIDTYTMRGRKEGETYQPLFTDHGFRYISVTGLSEALPLESVKGVVLDGIGQTTSAFECSDPLVNQLFSNIQWGQRGNFQTVPTDCPQRDERQGWTGDAQVFARAATYFSPWVDKFYARWFHSMRDNQGVDGSYFNYFPITGRPPYGYRNDATGWMGWMEAGIIVPWQVYQQYGDVKVLGEHYDSMVQYMDFLERQSKDYLQVPSGIGDHLALEYTEIGLTNTAYYAYDAYMMSKIAAALGKSKDSAKYAALYENVKKAFVAKYADADSPYATTQTAYALPLYFGLYEGEAKEKAVEKLVANIEAHSNTLTTGFIGTPYLCGALSDAGRDDVAYTLFEQTAYPSWLYPVLQGATTMWERWNSYTIERGFGPVDMNSFNHYAYGAIAEWMFAHCLGIQRDEDHPAYKHILLQPKVGGKMHDAHGHFETPYGVVTSGWEKTEGGYVYRVTVPANTTASLTLQTNAGKESVSIVKGSEGVGPLRSLKGKVLCELQSGSYEFAVSLN